MNRQTLAQIEPTTMILEEYNRVATPAASAGIKGFVFFGLFVITAFVGGAGYWAASSKLDGAVVAPASLVVEGNRKTVAHLEGGTVRAILVGDGDMVQAGQTLVELDSTDLGFDLDVLEGQLGDLMVRRARLLAQISGAAEFRQDTTTDTFRVVLPAENWTSVYATQKQLFLAEMRTRSAEQDLMEQRVTSLQRQIEGLDQQRQSNGRQIDITLQELANLETLLAKGLVAASRVSARRIEIERLNGVDASLETQAAQAASEIQELRLTAIGEQKQLDEANSIELAQIDAQLATLVPQYSGTAERLKRIAIKAPVSGRVVDLTVFTAGGVVRPGAAILDIVPNNEPLVVEARVNTSDVDKLVIGQSTRIRLSAFDQGKVPEATGKIVDISADSLEDERTGKPYFTARVQFDVDQPEEVSALELIPGMPADLFVNTGERSALSYLTQPLQDRIARTFIE